MWEECLVLDLSCALLNNFFSFKRKKKKVPLFVLQPGHSINWLGSVLKSTG